MRCDARVALSSVAEIVSTKVAVSSLTGHPYISTENLLPNLGGLGNGVLPDAERVNSFNKSDTLFSNIRPYFRKVHYASVGGGCSADVLVFRTKDPQEFWPAYLYYCLADRTFIDHTMATCKGAKMPRGDKGAMLQYQVSKPDLDTQKRVSSFLRSVDESIQTLQQQNSVLESIAQTLFRSWFVNFDPVHAKAAGNEPEAMSAELAALFPSEFEDSELGRIPMGWEVSPYADAIEIYSGGTPKTNVDEYWSGDIPWFSVTDAPAPGQVFVLKTEKHITKTGLAKSPAKLLPARSTIISARGTVGKIGMVSGQMTINQSCYALAPKNGQGAYWTYFQTKNLVSTLKQMAHGGVFDTITRDTFRGVKVASPSDALFDEFSNASMPLFDAIECNGRLVNCLTELRDHLLPRLISGKLSLEDAEASVAEIASGLEKEPA